jgi:hypothetical protein
MGVLQGLIEAHRRYEATTDNFKIKHGWLLFDETQWLSRGFTLSEFMHKIRVDKALAARFYPVIPTQHGEA